MPIVAERLGTTLEKSDLPPSVMQGALAGPLAGVIQASANRRPILLTLLDKKLALLLLLFLGGARTYWRHRSVFGTVLGVLLVNGC